MIYMQETFAGLTHNVIASLRRRRGNPVFPLAAFLDCFAALAMTKVLRKSCFEWDKAGKGRKLYDQHTQNPIV
jgi:hypothetical protein